MIATGPETDLLEEASIALCAREPEELEPLTGMLREMGCRVRVAESVEELCELIEREKVDVVLAHVCPSRQEFFQILGRQDLPPVIPVLCHADRHLYLETLRCGAFDCVPLPAPQDELRRVLTLAMKSERKRSAAPIPC